MKRREYLKAERKIYERYSGAYAKYEKAQKKKADAMMKELGVAKRTHLKPETIEFLKKHGS